MYRYSFDSGHPGLHARISKRAIFDEVCLNLGEQDSICQIFRERSSILAEVTCSPQNIKSSYTGHQGRPRQTHQEDSARFPGV